MKCDKNRHAILFRNAIAFFLIYLVMMSTMTYLTADRIKNKLVEKTQDLNMNFSNIMDQTISEWDEENEAFKPITPTIKASFYQQMGVSMRSGAYENIYLRAEIYNGLNETIAKTGNVMILSDLYDNPKHYDENSMQTSSRRETRYLPLDEYMSVDEINNFFAPSNCWYILNAEVTGLDSKRGIIPQKMELFENFEHTEPMATKTISEISDDAQTFGTWEPCEASFERIGQSGLITKKDMKRYQNCTKAAELSLKQYQKNGSIYGEPIKGNIFHVRYGCVNMSNGYGDPESRYLSFGAEFYPLEIAVSQLIPVYILSFLFLLILMLILSAKLNDIFNKQAALEKSRHDLTNAIAHELKTPLGIIRNFSEGLKEKINENKREHYLDIIISETEYMDKMVLDMLVLSQLESGIKLNMQNYSLTQITKQVTERYKEMIDNKGISVTVTSPDDCIIKCDRKRMEQVISNLLSNAVCYTPENEKISISISGISEIITFAIENSGQHISADKINHIWDAYYKIDTARSNPKGTGLGLSIVKNILTAHGFSYGAENTESGVMFWFAVKIHNKNL